VMNRSRPTSTDNLAQPLGRIVGKGEMADRVRSYDWAATSLGPIAGWSRELITIVNLTLCSPTPARAIWGSDRILIYNDAYRPIPGRRHPEALGKSAREVYREAWHVVGPVIEEAFSKGVACSYENLVVPLETESGVQDFYLNYSFNPVYEDDQVAGLFGTLQDRTTEVIALRRLRETEARSSRILQSIGDAVIVTDADTRITTMNGIAEELTGWTTAEAAGELLADVFRIVNETTRRPADSPADKVKATGRIVGLANHTILLAKDGREISIDDSGAPILDDNGKLSGIVLVFRNIESRREAEREKEKINERLSGVLAATNDAIVSVDRNWVMTYLNPKARQLYSADRELGGRNLWEAFPNADYVGSPFREHFQRAMNEGIAGAFDAFYPEPLDLWLRLEVYPTRDGIVTYSRDITKEKTLLDELVQKREQAERQKFEIESVYRTAPIGLALFDVKDFRYLRLNDRQAEFFGLKPEQIVGRTLTEMAPIEGLKELFEQVLAGQPVVNFPLEGELVTRPGELRYWTVSYFPVYAADGTVQAITAASLEVTQQKKAERALIESEKLAVVGRLASSIAHEINNPLESVTNLLYLAANVETLPEAREHIQTAQRELRRVSAITSQTLRFHKQATKPQAMDSEESMKSVVSMYQGRIVNARIRIEERYRADRPVRCFEGEIRQLLSNLVNNSIDAIQPNAGRLLLRNRTGTDWSTGRRGLILTVADTGSGMSPATLARIFEPFYTTKGAVGTGLGLWVSQEIVTRHHGVLRVRSSQKPGCSGTVFALFLPFDGADRSNAESGVRNGA
jgi:PAS domain S-box-containing protein